MFTVCKYTLQYANMQENYSQIANNILDRLHTALKIEQNQKLAEFLGVSPSTVSSWRNRKTIDYDLIFSKCNGVNLHWLITGEGSMFANNEAGRALRALHHPDEPEIIGNASHILAQPVITEDELAVIKALIQRLEKSD